jgi:copper(I)-binding protein
MTKVLLVAVSLSVAACGGSATDLQVNDPRIGEPTGPHTAMYFTVDNVTDSADALVGASTDVAASIEIHETIMGTDGTTVMQPVDVPLDVEAGGTLVLEPGGVHLMLVDVERLEVGDTVNVTLQWQMAGAMQVEAEVVEPQHVMEEEEDHG